MLVLFYLFCGNVFLVESGIYSLFMHKVFVKIVRLNEGFDKCLNWILVVSFSNGSKMIAKNFGLILYS